MLCLRNICYEGSQALLRVNPREIGLKPRTKCFYGKHHILLHFFFQQDAPLHFAAEKGYYDIVKYIVGKGSADVNIRNHRGVSEIYHCECCVHTVTLKC